jgi:hypothetical protein
MNSRLFVVVTAAVLSLFVTSLLASCGPQEMAKDTGKPAAAATQPPAQLLGDKYENAVFSITVPKDWRKIDLREGGIQITEHQVGLDSVLVNFYRGTTPPDWAKKKSDDNVKAYNASAPVEVNAFGKTWWKTTYTFMETYNTNYYRVIDGALVQVKLSGKNHENNQNLKAILDTLVFKQ